MLVVRGPSRQFNPLLTEQSVQQALKDDPEGARAEWGRSFDLILATFLDEQLIVSAIDYSTAARTTPAFIQILRLRRSLGWAS